jgi:hypothetical protein
MKNQPYRPFTLAKDNWGILVYTNTSDKSREAVTVLGDEAEQT